MCVAFVTFAELRPIAVLIELASLSVVTASSAILSVETASSAILTVVTASALIVKAPPPVTSPVCVAFVTFRLLSAMSWACAGVIVVVLPAIAVVELVPIVKLDVPAPITLLTSAWVTLVANVGVPPPENTAGSANDVYPSPLVMLLLLMSKVTLLKPSLTNVTVPPLTLPALT